MHRQLCSASAPLRLPGPGPGLLALWGPFSSLVAGRSDHSGQDAKPASSGQSPLVQGLWLHPLPFCSTCDQGHGCTFGQPVDKNSKRQEAACWKQPWIQNDPRGRILQWTELKVLKCGPNGLPPPPRAGARGQLVLSKPEDEKRRPEVPRGC